MKKGFKRKGGFPDNNKDGKITQADIYLQKKKTGTIKKKGGVMKYEKGGMSKEEIMKKQQEYNKNNPNNKLAVDGIMGPKTRAALKGKKKMMGGGMKKMMYKSGGFLEPKIPNLDDL